MINIPAVARGLLAAILMEGEALQAEARERAEAYGLKECGQPTG